LEEAVAAYREALKENTRERVPLEWASGSPTPIAAARTGAPGTGRIAITLAQTVTLTQSATGAAGFPLAAGAALTLTGSSQLLRL
jgi:hypothetical protein